MPFSSQFAANPPTVIAPGLRMSNVCISTDGTASSVDVAVPVSDVLNVNAVVVNKTAGAATTVLGIANVVNTTSGLYTLIAASTRALDVLTPTIIRITSSNATVVADIAITIISKG